METIKAFFGAYGDSFLMMVVIGFVIAIILEITVKKAIEWLEKKFEGKERVLSALKFIKIVLIQAGTWFMVIKFTMLLVNNMPLPANKALYPVWVCLVYIIQYLFSCWGIKGVINLIKKRAEKRQAKADEKAIEKARAEAISSHIVKVEGYKNLYRNIETNEFCDEKGNKV